MTLSALPKSLDLLEAIIADAGQSNVASLARLAELPVATAHRHVAALVRARFLKPAGYGRHIAGPRLHAMLAMVDKEQMVANVATPKLQLLAKQTQCIVQLGTLENDMVTYRVKVGNSSGDLFTKVGMQLEAYCSAIGKVLLAHLPETEREAYLANGPFVALTDKTITDSAMLRRELEMVRKQGFAVDDEEVAEGLRCIAVPLLNQDDRAIAAISVSGLRKGFRLEVVLAKVQQAANKVRSITG